MNPYPLKPIHWVLDWDGTITRKDTLNALVNIAASSKPDFPTHERWQEVVDAYVTDYTTRLEQLTPNGTLPKTLTAEKALLKALKPVEQASIDRVSASGIFTGLTRDVIHDGTRKARESGEVEKRPGFTMPPFCVKSNASILSVNWSRAFIRSCLAQSSRGVEFEVFANELDGIDQDQPSSGVISPDADPMKIISSDDKLRYLNTRIRPAHPDRTIVYVGDSWPDIECLVDADVGICIRDEPMGSSQQKLADAFSRLGIDCVHIGQWGKRRQSCVYWARDFGEILSWAQKTVGESIYFNVA